MSFIQRIDIYQQIEALRQRPLIVYTTSLRPGATGNMAGDVVNEIIDQLERLPVDANAVDLLIESSGGDGLTSWRIASLLRSRVSTFSILIPHSAFSAATILALGADEIVMGKYASLGPIDPQITAQKKDGSTQQFGFEDIVAFLDFSKREAGLTEQKHIETVFKLLCETVDPSTIGFASRASALSVSIGEKLLQMHMSNAEDKAKATAIANQLNKSFFSHGHALSRTEAKGIGLNIVDPTENLERLMWSVHNSFEKEIKTRSPFNPIAEFLADPAAAPYLNSPPTLHIPPQVDQQVALQIMQNYVSQQLQAVTPNVIKELKYAFVESARHGSEFFQRMKILVNRTLDLKFVASAVILDSGWREVPIPVTHPAPTVNQVP